MAEQAELTATPRRTLFDGATVFGLLGGLVLVALAIALGGSAGAFLNGPGLLIVIGGTLAVTTMSFPLSDVLHTFGGLGSTVFYRERDPQDVAYTMLELADFCRRQGVLKLQGEPLQKFIREPFL